MPRSLLALFACSLLAGCGSSDASSDLGGSSATCAFSGAVPKAPKPPSSETSVESYVEGQALVQLDAYLGTYLRGEATVYRGTLSAHDNQGVLGPPPSHGFPGYESQTIRPGPAVAALTLSQGIASLTVHSSAAHKYVVLQQSKSDPSTTSVGIILADKSSGGNTGTCTHCVPDFAARPGSIDFSNIESSQVVNIGSSGPQNQDVTLHTYATASLELVPPCMVTFEDLEELNAASGLTFVSQDTEWVYELAGQAYDPKTGCAVSYTVELYVSATNLADYGVRSFSSMVVPGCEG
jgi:hypothetical protein